MRFSVAIPVTAVLTFLSGVPLAGQAVEPEGPRAGSWAVEGSNSSAALLRFRSPTSAWVLNAAAHWLHQETSGDDPLLESTQDVNIAELVIGMRRYRNAGRPLRPFTTVSAIARYVKSPLAESWDMGGALEMGASYFFSPHVSLGARGDISALYGRRDQNVTDSEASVIEVAIGNLRLIGAVYF